MSDRKRYEALLQRVLDVGGDPLDVSHDASELADTLRALETLSLTTSPAAPSSNLRDSILASASPGDSLAAFVRRTSEFFQIDRSRAQQILASIASVDSEPWFDDDVPGVRMLRVEGAPEAANVERFLIHLQPGVVYPTHRHLGDEWCMFLQGRGMEAGREWNPGDLVLNPRGSDHPPLEAIGDEPFVLAIVLHEGVSFAHQV